MEIRTPKDFLFEAVRSGDEVTEKWLESHLISLEEYLKKIYIDLTNLKTEHDDVWKDHEIKPAIVKLPASNAPAEDTIDAFRFHRYSRGTEESVYATWIVPEDFTTGDGSVKGHYTLVVENPPTSGGTNVDENVRMGFEYKKIGDGSVFDFGSGTSTGYIDETIEVDETAGIVHITDDGTCTTTGWESHDTILFRFYRDATAAEDTYDNEASASDNDVWVQNYHLQYLSDKYGEDA